MRSPGGSAMILVVGLRAGCGGESCDDVVPMPGRISSGTRLHLEQSAVDAGDRTLTFDRDAGLVTIRYERGGRAYEERWRVR